MSQKWVWLIHLAVWLIELGVTWGLLVLASSPGAFQKSTQYGITIMGYAAWTQPAWLLGVFVGIALGLWGIFIAWKHGPRWSMPVSALAVVYSVILGLICLPLFTQKLFFFAEVFEVSHWQNREQPTCRVRYEEIEAIEMTSSASGIFGPWIASYRIIRRDGISHSIWPAPPGGDEFLELFKARNVTIR